MLFSTRGTYAIKAMIELAKRQGTGLVTIAEIAQAQGIPARFLESILLRLKQGGLTESSRGNRGGYTLARVADEISVGDVVRLFEEGLMPGLSAESPASRHGLADLERKAQEAMAAVFDSIHFQHLADQETHRLQKDMGSFVI